MNTFSKTHKRFSELLRNPRVLENPEEFLGPNFEEVLNFWMILEELSEDQLRVINERYFAFRNKNYSEWDKAADLTIEASKEAVGEYYAYDAGRAVYNVTNSYVACRATTELIAMHKILEDRQRSLTFFPMILNL